MPLLQRTLALIFLLPAISLAQAEEPAEQPEPHNAAVCSPDGIALGGYDVVAYHTEDKAVKGSSDFSVDHEGLTYQFSQAAHQALFEEDPTKYLPHFSGWCAIALARNRLTCPDYENFKVEDGKLLLFETIAFVNGRTVWDSNPIKNLISAEKNYNDFFGD